MLIILVDWHEVVPDKLDTLILDIIIVEIAYRCI